MPKESERIHLYLPRLSLNLYIDWAKKMLAEGHIGPDSTHGKASAFCAQCVEEQPVGSLVLVPPMQSSLEKWLNACCHSRDQLVRDLGREIHNAWLASAKAAEPLPKPPEPIPPEVMAHVRSITPEELDYIPGPVEDEPAVEDRQKVLFG